ncbi:hypothetical protein [Novilysobacter arseniciresistens]|uniref:hypothetical protein n=1 Tax=Novilysobacter arseniciresistens TaxID=1385522 RepID=UPI00055E64EA|nr:hypothetical protein [Lysobacter arseniciresistens]
MTRLRLRRLLPFLRVLALGLFALGLVLQPVMAAAGEMHELAHDPTGTHAHGQHADDLDTELDAGDEQDEDGARTLHVLLHFSHCCGATAALLPVLKPLPVMPLNGRLAIAKTPIPLQARLTSPFKPPIFV